MYAPPMNADGRRLKTRNLNRSYPRCSASIGGYLPWEPWRLPGKSQSELHLPRVAQGAAEFAKARRRQRAGGGVSGARSGRVEAHGVGDVVTLPAELELLPLRPGHGEVLVYAGIDIEESLAAKIGAAARFAGEVFAESSECGSRILP